MKLRILTLLAVAGLATAGCEGDRGPEGAPGPQGPPGTPVPGQGNVGLKLEILSATVAEGQAPVVTFKATDPSGAAVDVRQAIQAGQLNPRFTLSALQDDGTYKSYFESQVPPATGFTGPAQPQAGSEPVIPAGQTFPLDRLVDQGGGNFQYTFGRTVTGVQAARTNTAGMWATWNRGEEGSFPASSSLSFVPAGGAVTDRQVVTDDACNKCHFQVQAHDSRRTVKLCLTCHNPGSADPETGNTVDMKVMVHKIHYGSGLPTSNDADPANDYKIIGFRGAVHDYSHVTMPPSHSTYIDQGSDPGLIRDCTICHQGANADNYKNNPSRAACFACHDNVNITTGVGHPGFAAANDTTCTTCHDAAQIDRNHSVNFDATSEFLFPERDYKITIDTVTLAAGAAPILEFTATLGGQPYNLRTAGTALGSLAFQAVPVNGLDYLTTGYYVTNVGGTVNALTDGALGAQVADIDAPGGKFRYTFPTAAALPADATGTYAFGVESMHREINGTVIKPAATFTPLVFKTVAGADASRTQIVSNDRCNSCHVELGFHSNRSRIGVEYCATCHNPNLDNRGRARFPTGTTGYEIESVDIGMMSHRLHTGADLPSVQAGGKMVLGAQRTGDAPADTDFSQFVMPGANSTGRCLTCHEPGTWATPGPDRLPVKRAIMACGTTTVTDPPTDCAGTTATGRTVTTDLTIPRATALCTSCHDGASTIAHAKLNTLDDNATLWDGSAGEIETCTTCHGEGKEFDALRVHAGEIP